MTNLKKTSMNKCHSYSIKKVVVGTVATTVVASGAIIHFMPDDLTMLEQLKEAGKMAGKAIAAGGLASFATFCIGTLLSTNAHPALQEEVCTSEANNKFLKGTGGRWYWLGHFTLGMQGFAEGNLGRMGSAISGLISNTPLALTDKPSSVGENIPLLGNLISFAKEHPISFSGLLCMAQGGFRCLGAKHGMPLELFSGGVLFTGGLIALACPDQQSTRPEHSKLLTVIEKAGELFPQAIKNRPLYWNGVLLKSSIALLFVQGLEKAIEGMTNLDASSAETIIKGMIFMLAATLFLPGVQQIQKARKHHHLATASQTK